MREATLWRPIACILLLMPTGAAVGQPLNSSVDLTFGLGDVQFASIRDMATDHEGNLVILDDRLCEVIVLNSGGTVVRRFGRRGWGPGEFRRPVALFVNSHGETFVYDAGARAISHFDVNGNFVRAHAAAVARMNARSFVQTSRGFIAATVPYGVVENVRLIPIGEASKSDTLVLDFRAGREIVVPNTNPGFVMRLPLQPRLVLALLEDSLLAVPLETSFGIDLVNLRSGRRRRVTSEVPPVVVPSDQRQQARQLMDQALRETAGRLKFSSAEFERRISVPEAYPRVAGLASDGTGGVWILRLAAASPPRYEAYNVGPSGRIHKVVTYSGALNARTDLLAVGKNYMYVPRSFDGVPVVDRIRLYK